MHHCGPLGGVQVVQQGIHNGEAHPPRVGERADIAGNDGSGSAPTANAGSLLGGNDGYGFGSGARVGVLAVRISPRKNGGDIARQIR